METFANIIAVIMIVVTTCSVIACITPTPQKTGWMKKLYSIIDWCDELVARKRKVNWKGIES